MFDYFVLKLILLSPTLSISDESLKILCFTSNLFYVKTS